MRGELSPPSPTPSSPVGGEVVLVSAPKPVCVERFPGIPAITIRGQAEVRMVEDVEELRIDAQLHVLAHLEPLRQIQIAPDEVRPSESVAPKIAELAGLRAIASGAGARARIDRGYEGVRIQPLNRSSLRHSGNGTVRVKRDSRHHAGELRAASVYDAVAVRRVGRAQHGKRQSAVKERRAGSLPAIDGTRQKAFQPSTGTGTHNWR